MGLGFRAPAAPELSKSVKTVPVGPFRAIAGQDLFREYCAVCHGADAKGNGPAADALKVAPPDLTQIARRNGGKFPEVRVENMISGETGGPIIHGAQEMPVWGPIFRHMGANQEMASVRLYNLVKYLEEVQEK